MLKNFLSITGWYGDVTFINPTPEGLTGWSSAEAEKKSFDDVFKIINEDTGESVESPFAIVMRLETDFEFGECRTKTVIR